MTAGLLHVLQAHFQYPVLHYFRPPDESTSLALQLGRLLELRRATKARMRQAPGAQDERNHAYLALGGALERYLRDVNVHFIPGRFGIPIGEDVDWEIDEAHDRLLRYMAYRPSAGQD
ncbi:MAG: hypothetical protein WD737_00045 [Gemmatimonadota bacterium]